MKIENAGKLTIPKSIAALIEKRDLQVNPTPNAHLRFYSYLKIWKNKELLKITVALKHYRKKLYMKIVAIHAVHSDICFVCDMEYNYFGAMGFRVGWYKEGICKHERVYERGWLWANDKYYDPFAPIINTELIDKLPEYKYSAYRQYPYQDLFKYLRIYEQFPQAEMFVKFGLSAYALSKQLLKKVGVDKKFRTWLLQHRSELS